MNDLPLASSRFLEGNFGPVLDERDDLDLTVVGEIPSALDGVFVRNGPNPQFAPRATYHWFAGDGMLHSVELRQRRARYRNRFVHTEGFVRERDAGVALWRGDLGMPDFENPNGPTRGNTANTALVVHHRKLLALWEAGAPHEIALPSLETVGPCSFGGALDGPFTAHPKVDPRTGELLFFGYDLLSAPHLRYGEARRDGTVAFVRDVALEKGTMIHDFAITERFAVIAVFPFPFELDRAMQGESPFVFDPDGVTRWAVIERGQPDRPVRWFESAPCYVYHFANAHDRDGRIVVEGCRMPRASIDFDSEIGGDNAGTLHRWTLDLADGSVREERLDERASEFPRINEALLGQRARYVYAALIDPSHALAQRSQFAVGWRRYDLERGESLEHRHGDGVFGGEGVFVPRPDAAREDDGWLVGFVHDTLADRSELRIVDATDFTAPPVARVLLPRRVPYGFHGAWIPSGST